jgi:hypothetical protein
MKTLLLLGMLLLPACGTTKVIEVPVQPEPCVVPLFPVMDAEASPFTPTGVALISVWVIAVDEWHEAVLSCPFIQARPGTDIRTALAGDPYLKTR